MEKRKVYKISIIDKEISRTEFDRNTFYTSDSELTLVFKLIEKDYTYEHGEILLYNENDKSFITRKITKQDNDFVYELDLDIIPHYGKWQAQLQLIKDGDVYTSKPFDFSIVNDLSNLAPQPTLTDINNWSTLKQSANELIDEMRDIIVDFESVELERENKENTRQQAELERENKESVRQNSELIRENQENKRQKEELERENNEKQRRISEFERVNKETTRQQAENQRQSTFEMSESERHTTFETAEQSRQSAELIRVENENQRNLKSVEEFIKLQDSIGGRNLMTFDSSDGFFKSKTNLYYADDISINKIIKVKPNTTYTIFINWDSISGVSNTQFMIGRGDKNGVFRTGFGNSIISYNNQVPVTYTTPNEELLYDYFSFRFLSNSTTTTSSARFYNFAVYEGVYTDFKYVKAPENYTIVSKEDYYNHIKLMNDFKDNQLNKVKQAVIALGGTI